MRYEFIKWRERATLALVWKLPRWLVYWCTIRLLAHATMGPYSSQVVTELNVMEALERWHR